ncbi:putative transmembrane protein, partial [Toxoplasma gondii MAS]
GSNERQRKRSARGTLIRALLLSKTHGRINNSREERRVGTKPGQDAPDRAALQQNRCAASDAFCYKGLHHQSFAWTCQTRFQFQKFCLKENLFDQVIQIIGPFFLSFCLFYLSFRFFSVFLILVSFVFALVAKKEETPKKQRGATARRGRTRETGESFS